MRARTGAMRASASARARARGRPMLSAACRVVRARVRASGRGNCSSAGSDTNGSWHAQCPVGNLLNTLASCSLLTRSPLGAPNMQSNLGAPNTQSN